MLCEDFCYVPLSERHVTGGPPILNFDIPAVYPAKLAKLIAKRRYKRFSEPVRLRIFHHHTDAPQSIGLLCVHRQRPSRRRAAEKRDEVAPSHFAPTVSGRVPQ